MAESQRMTAVELVAKVMAGEHGDFVRDAVALIARELMEAEITGQIGAAHGEVSEARATHRNGYRPRAWETRAGELERADALARAPRHPRRRAPARSLLRLRH